MPANPVVSQKVTFSAEQATWEQGSPSSLCKALQGRCVGWAPWGDRAVIVWGGVAELSACQSVPAN